MTVKEFITQENLPAWVADDIRAFQVADMKDAWNKALEGKQWHLLKWIIINGGIISHFPDLRRALGSFILMGGDSIGKTIWHKLPVDLPRASQVFVTWAIKQTGWKEQYVPQPPEAYY